MRVFRYQQKYQQINLLAHSEKGLTVGNFETLSQDADVNRPLVGTGMEESCFAGRLAGNLSVMTLPESSLQQSVRQSAPTVAGPSINKAIFWRC